MVVEVVEHTGEAQPTFPIKLFLMLLWAGVRAKRGEAGAKRGKAGQSGARGRKAAGAWRGEAGPKQGGVMWTLVDKMGNNET